MQLRNNHRRSLIRGRLLSATLALLALVAAVVPAADAADREAVTLWWVIFNNPEACGEICDGDDLANAAVEPSVAYATGEIARGGGRLRLVASLYEQARRFADEVIGGPGLIDAEKAEIHLVIRSHGPRLRRPAAVRHEQITRFLDSGCEELGGPNLCRDIQFAVHPPGQASSTSAVFWFPDLEGGRAIAGANSSLFRDSTGVRVVVETRMK